MTTSNVRRPGAAIVYHDQAISHLVRTPTAIQSQPSTIEDKPVLDVRGHWVCQAHNLDPGDPDHTYTYAAGLIVWEDTNQVITNANWRLVNGIDAMNDRPAPYDSDFTPIPVTPLNDTGLTPPDGAAALYACHVSVQPTLMSEVNTASAGLLMSSGWGGMFIDQGTVPLYGGGQSWTMNSHAELNCWAPFMAYVATRFFTAGFDPSTTYRAYCKLTRILHTDKFNSDL